MSNKCLPPTVRRKASIDWRRFDTGIALRAEHHAPARSSVDEDTLLVTRGIGALIPKAILLADPVGPGIGVAKITLFIPTQEPLGARVVRLGRGGRHARRPNR